MHTSILSEHTQRSEQEKNKTNGKKNESPQISARPAGIDGERAFNHEPSDRLKNNTPVNE